MDPKELKEQQEQFKKTIDGARESLDKSLSGLKKTLEMFNPEATKKIITSDGSAEASKMQGLSIRIDFASKESRDTFYNSLKEFSNG